MLYGYVRVSTDKQTVENQKLSISSYIRTKNLREQITRVSETESIYGNKQILSPLNVQTAKSIAIGTLGNMLGNTMSGSIRGGMMQLGKPQNLFTEFLGQQYGHQQATAIDEATNK